MNALQIEAEKKSLKALFAVLVDLEIPFEFADVRDDVIIDPHNNCEFENIGAFMSEIAANVDAKFFDYYGTPTADPKNACSFILKEVDNDTYFSATKIGNEISIEVRFK